MTAIPTCRWTSHTPTSYVADLTEAMQRDRTIAQVLSRDLAERKDLNEHVREAANAHLARRTQSVELIKRLLETINMGRDTARDHALYALGRGPCTVRNLAGVLYQHGRTFEEAETQAKEALEQLVTEKRAERKEVHDVDLYLVTSSTPVEKSTEPAPRATKGARP